MRRTNRDNAVCLESLEKALASCPETYGHIDLLCGGWPCQDNSIAGNRKGHDGEKSGLWKELRRIIGLFQPSWIVLENVPGLFSVNDGKDFWAVISDLDKIGYCVAWNVLDSRFFGLAQRRKRVFIVGSLGNIGASKIFLERQSHRRNNKAIKKVGTVGLCISTRDGERQDSSTETIIASTIGTSSNPDPNYGTHFVAYTIGTDQRGQPFKLHTENLVAEIDANREGKIARLPNKLDSSRGIVIGNAVSVPVAEWIGKRIYDYENGLLINE